MKYRRLGDTGLKVSQLGLGTMPFGGDTDEDEAQAIFTACLDAGINHVRLRRRLQRRRGREDPGPARRLRPRRGRARDQGRVPECRRDQPARRVAGPPPARRSRRSLTRLGTDRIDLYYLHRFDDRTAIDDTLRTLDALVAAGKILHLGVSNFAAWQVATALGRSALNGWAPIVAIQPMYNLVKRQAEVELLPLAQSADLAVFPYSPLAGGLLTGKYGTHAGFGRGSARRQQDVPRPLPRRGGVTPPPPSWPRSPPSSVATRRRSPSRGSAATRQ